MRKPHHPHHPHGRGAVGTRGGQQRSGSVGAVQHRKPRPPVKVHKKPAPAKKPKKPAAKKPVRKWSPGWDVDCCSAQALGTLLGWDWTHVLALYGRTGGAATIGDTLAACWGRVDLFGLRAFAMEHEVSRAPVGHAEGLVASVAVRQNEFSHEGLILGVTLPEPHALAVTPDGRWWSWGELFDPDDWPELVIDEAWAVLL